MHLEASIQLRFSSLYRDNIHCPQCHTTLRTMSMPASSPRFIAIYVLLLLASALVIISLRSSSHSNSPNHSSTWVSKIGANPSKPDAYAPRVAYATFLSGNTHDTADEEDEDDNTDGYYLSARVLIYQLLHSPTASPNLTTTPPIPFLVLCTPNVSARKRARLTLDGATVIPVETLSSDWVQASDARWRDGLTKLRLWQQIQFSKICFIDPDTLVTKPLDEVFYDEATITQHAGANPAQLKMDEAALPRTYMLATHADLFGFDHEFPPKALAPTEPSYLNCGFFVFAPSMELFDYYLSLLALPRRFDPAFADQNLLNYAHRREGNMPWTPLWYGWNVNWPTRRDWEGGARSFHAKFWDGDPAHDVVLKAVWREQRAEMEGFYRGREGSW